MVTVISVPAGNEVAPYAKSGRTRQTTSNVEIRMREFISVTSVVTSGIFSRIAGMRLRGGVSHWLQLNGELTGIANWLKVQVVYKPGFADKHGEQRVAGARDARDRLERLGVYDFGVIGRGEGLAFQHFAHHRLQMKRIARASGELGLGGCKRTVQKRRGAAFLGAEIGIAGG